MNPHHPHDANDPTTAPRAAQRASTVSTGTLRRMHPSMSGPSASGSSRPTPERSGSSRALTTIAPRPTQTIRLPAAPTRPAPSHTPRWLEWRGWRWFRPIAILAVIVIVVGVFGARSIQSLTANPRASTTPLPTGRGPSSWTTISSEATVTPPRPGQTYGLNGVFTLGQTDSIEPCHDSVMFVPNISEWTVPPGCYGLVYTPNPANYIARPGFGWCNWWVRVTHPNQPDITENTSYPRGSTPKPGAAIFFDGNEQGAGSDGHWAQTVAVAPDHYWVLISEMNFAWRGAGFGKVDYRYIHVAPGVHFVYI